MLLTISPAKKLDFDGISPTQTHHQPLFLDDAQKLIDVLKEKPTSQIKQLMHLSDNLAKLNAKRYQNFELPFTEQNAKQALFAFQGDVYASMQATTFTDEQIAFTNKHLRILSGLYGVLRPLDLMQPYRLEMGTRLSGDWGDTLYDFWGDTLTERLNADLAELKSNTLVNLASNEYFKAVNLNKLNGELVTPVFKEEKEGKYRILGLFAKRARGAMCRFVVENSLTEPTAMRDFNWEGYAYNVALTEKAKKGEMVFTRKQPEKKS